MQASTPSKVGAQMLELFASKVVVMMMLLLTFYVFLEAFNSTTDLYRLQLFTLTTLAQTSGLHSDPFNATLELYTNKTYWTRELNASSDRPEPILVKVGGEVVFNGTQEADGADLLDLSVRREEELMYITEGDSSCHLTWGQRGRQALDNSVCLTVIVYDRRLLFLSDLRSQLYLTGMIVLLLLVGMLLVALDMQRIMLNPLERIARILKIVTGRRWRKRVEQVRNEAAAGRKFEAGEEADQSISWAVEEIELEALTVVRMVKLFMDDIEQARWGWGSGGGCRERGSGR